MKSKLNVGDRVRIDLPASAHNRETVIVVKAGTNGVHMVGGVYSAYHSVLEEKYLKRIRRYAVLKPTRNGQFRFNLIGENGKVIATSETYTRKTMALKTLRNYFNDFRVEDRT